MPQTPALWAVSPRSAGWTSCTSWRPARSPWRGAPAGAARRRRGPSCRTAAQVSVGACGRVWARACGHMWARVGACGRVCGRLPGLASSCPSRLRCCLWGDILLPAAPFDGRLVRPSVLPSSSLVCWGGRHTGASAVETQFRARESEVTATFCCDLAMGTACLWPPLTRR